ncbi:hypothetical protein FOY91_16880 [Sphingomonas solaris]|uniref:Uncharacterized protein n=1 Tax=Alterirhizorhabdus solaris TaxID=2529389 RepID=A0A558QW99_9SPHN|nr:hypothetical protein FOY91_16880 [Sphingomonas solaris]
MKLLDTLSKMSFDHITRMVSQIFGLPVAAVSLTDRDRQWFKSRVDIPIPNQLFTKVWWFVLQVRSSADVAPHEMRAP